MRRILMILLSIGWVCCNAQPMPNWITHRPQAVNSTYYYRVTIGEGKEYNSAYANAFAKAILESSWKLGVQVTTANDVETVKDEIYDNITVHQVQSNIPINKVCEYVERLTNVKFRVYCLWQIGTPGSVAIFDDFTNCE